MFIHSRTKGACPFPRGLYASATDSFWCRPERCYGVEECHKSDIGALPGVRCATEGDGVAQTFEIGNVPPCRDTHIS